jgi:hypothetical protein
MARIFGQTQPVFGTSASRVAYVDLSSSITQAAMTVSLQNGALANSNILLQKFVYDRSANFQITPSLRNKLYVYGFGERIGSFVISGYAFMRSCNVLSIYGSNGLDQLINTYNTYSLSSSDTLSRISITPSSTVIRGFLVGLRVESMKPELGMLSFQMQYVGIPQVLNRQS